MFTDASRDASLLGDVSFFAAAEDDFRHEGTAAHAEGFLFAVRAGISHFVPEALEGFAVPGVLDGGFSVQLHLVALLLVERAGDHDQVRADVAAVAAALAGVQGLRQNTLAEVQGAGDVAGVHADLEGVPPVHLGEELCDTGIVEIQHVRLRALPGRFVKQKDHRVDSFWEVVPLQAVDGLVDAVFAQDVMDVGLHTGIQQHLNGIQGVLAAVPAHRHRAAVFLAECGQLRSHAVAGGGEVWHQIVLPADAQQVFKVFVLIRVAAAAQGKLVTAAFALFCNPTKVLDGHVGLLHQQAALIAADPGLDAEPGLAVDAVTHDAHVDQMRERRHKRVNARVPPLLVQNPGPYIGPGFRVKGGFEMIFPVVDDVLHGFASLIVSLVYSFTHQV